MNTQQLYINDQLCDLTDSQPIAQTIQVNNIADIKDRQSTYTNSVKLPKSAINKTIFGYADSDSFTQDQPYQNLKAKLVQNGAEVLPLGQANLQTVSDFFETQLTYGLTGFVDIIGNYKLADLDWSFIPDFIWDVQNVVNAMNGIGQPWPMVDYGQLVDGGAVVDIRFIRPAIYARQILTAIESYTQYIKPSEPNNRYSGYIFQGGILSHPTFLNEIITCSATNFYGYNGLIATPGDTISIAKNLPDFTISDWLKDFMQRYFLTPVVDNVARTVTFHSFDELYINKPRARNWTNKFVNDALTDQFIFGAYGQINKFTWDKTDDAFLPAGKGQIDILNNSLPQSVDAITSIFGNSNTSKFLFSGTLQIAYIDKFKIRPTSAYIPYDIDTTVRILNLRVANGIFDITDGTVHIFNNQVKYAFFSNFADDGIGWQGQINNFGTGFVKLISRVRVITRYVSLTPLDIAYFDFFTPVYDEFEAKFYYVNQITNFIPGVKTKVQLCRM